MVSPSKSIDDPIQEFDEVLAGLNNQTGKIDLSLSCRAVPGQGTVCTLTPDAVITLADQLMRAVLSGEKASPGGERRIGERRRGNRLLTDP